jgi:hypothetical protein
MNGGSYGGGPDYRALIVEALEQGVEVKGSKRPSEGR